MKKVRILFSLVILFAFAMLFGGEVKIGEETFRLPVPKGMVEAQKEYPAKVGIFEAFTPPVSRLLAVFGKKEELEKLGSVSGAKCTEYYMVQTFRATENHKMTDAEFAEAAKAIKEEMNRLFAASRDQINQLIEAGQKKLSTEEKPKIQETLSLGVCFEEKEAIGSLMLIHMSDGKETTKILCHYTLMRAKGKVLYLYSYLPYHDKADIETVKNLGKTFYDSVRKANR